MAKRLINSGNLILVTAADDDKRNVTPIAWHMPISSEPPFIAIALSKKHYISELIMVSEEFTINIPNWPLLDNVKYCGSHSGRDTDKFEDTGLTSEPPVKLLESPRIKECIGAIECELYETKEIGDHYIFIGQPIYAEADEKLFKDNVWNPGKSELIYHFGGEHFQKIGKQKVKV